MKNSELFTQSAFGHKAGIHSHLQLYTEAFEPLALLIRTIDSLPFTVKSMTMIKASIGDYP